MKSLKDLLNGKNSHSPLAKGLKASEVIAAADYVLEKFFGVEIKKYAIPSSFKNGTLSISCASSVASQEIKLNEELILKEINSHISSSFVEKIRYLS